MIVLSAGMPKAGTGWYYNLANDLLVAAGHQDARAVRDRHGLRETLRAANCNLPTLDRASLERIDAVSREGNTFVVKTHRGPTKPLRELVAAGRFKVTYIYRDLRDVIVSALDRGQTMRSNGNVKRHLLFGPYRSFAKLRTVPGAIRWARWRLLPVWRAYSAWDAVHLARYEDLSTDPLAEMKRLAAFLEVEVPEAVMNEIIDRYRRERIKTNKPGSGMHLNKGVAGRYRDALSPEQQSLCVKRLGPVLQQMGYST